MKYKEMKNVMIDKPVKNQNFAIVAFKALEGVKSPHKEGILGIAKVRGVYASEERCEAEVKNLTAKDDFHVNFVFPVGQFFFLKSSEPQDGVEEIDMQNLSLSETESTAILNDLRGKTVEEEKRIMEEIQRRADAIRSSNVKAASGELSGELNAEPLISCPEDAYLTNFFKIFAHHESIQNDLRLTRTKVDAYFNFINVMQKLVKEHPDLVNLAEQKYKETCIEGLEHPDFHRYLKSGQKLLDEDLCEFVAKLNKVGGLPTEEFSIAYSSLPFKQRGVKSKRKLLSRK